MTWAARRIVAIGIDRLDRGQACSAGTIGHTGFTGTGLWVDFERGLAWTLLTNRVHPTRHFDSGIFELRPATGDAVVAGFDAMSKG
nr:beta-lactamase family protein [Sphingomonas sp. ABOLH]